MKATTVELDAGHLSLVSNSKQVADLILAAAGRKNSGKSEHDPEKVGTGSPRRSCSIENLERDRDSIENDRALGRSL
jgi:hypothetical protein